MSKNGVTRRDVLLAGLYGASVCLPLPSFAAVAATEPQRWLGVVFDERFSQSRAFSKSASRQNIQPYGFNGDMSHLWFEQLLPEIQRRPQPLLGLTSARGLFCFEQLAWSAGLRVAKRIEKIEASHNIHLDAPQVGTLDWGSVLMALSRRTTWRDCTHANPCHQDGTGAEALVAWVIAPSQTIKLQETFQ